MKNSKSINSRLRDLEGRKGLTVLLHFADGNTRGIDIARDYQLKLFAHVCARLRALPDGELQDAPPYPRTPSDKLIDLLGAAVSAEGNVFVTSTIFEMCHQIAERRKERARQIPLQGKA
jgi:hypothetical protein